MNVLELTETRHRHLGRLLSMQAQDNGATEFLINDEQRITFAEAESITNRLAAGFSALGVSSGDRVSFYMGNLPELVLMCLALNKINAVWVPICTDYKGDWLSDALVRSRANVLVTDAGHLPRIQAVESELKHTHLVVLEEEAAARIGATSYHSLASHAAIQPDYDSMNYGDTCAILWTSGTTGKSKGVMISHNNWIRACLMGTYLQYDVRPGDVAYCPLPLYNAGAWITAIAEALIKGIGVAIEQQFSVGRFMERVKQFRATQTIVVGSMGVFLMGSPAREDDADSTLRQAGINPLPADMWAPFEKRFGVKLVRSGFGQSECLMSLNHEHCDIVAPSHSLGFPPPDMDVRLFDDHGIEVEDGQPGEICVRPLEKYLLFNGYFDNEEATAGAFRGDWFLTGDMARKDKESGAFFYIDRKKDAVRFGGRNISTMEVESVVIRHPDVQEAAAFGIPSPQLASEDELKIDVVLAPGSRLTCEALAEFINNNAPYFFVPRYMEFVEELPYTPNKKIQKYKLRERGVTDRTWDLKQSSFKVTR